MQVFFLKIVKYKNTSHKINAVLESLQLDLALFSALTQTLLRTALSGQSTFD